MKVIIIRVIELISPLILLFFHIINYKRNDKINMNTALEKLMKYSPKPKEFNIDADNVINVDVDLMIIIPCYNAEKYLDACITSILNQKTSYTYKIILVNDGSTDNTLELIQKYEINSNISVINQLNKGVSSARNSALRNICGRYILFVDSDDVLLENSIERLLEVAINENADIVEGEHIRFSDREFNLINKTDCGHFQFKIVNPAMEFRGYPWGKVFKADLFKRFKFPEGYLFEDVIVSRIIIYLSKKCIKISKNIYGYRVNPNGITSTVREKNRAIETYYLTHEILKKQYELGLLCDETINKFFLETANDFSRISNKPIVIKECCFYYTSHIYCKYYTSYFDNEEMFNKMEFKNIIMHKALINNNYRVYSALSRLYPYLK